MSLPPKSHSKSQKFWAQVLASLPSDEKEETFFLHVPDGIATHDQ